jgi:hypothetical protein
MQAQQAVDRANQKPAHAERRRRLVETKNGAVIRKHIGYGPHLVAKAFAAFLIDLDVGLCAGTMVVHSSSTDSGIHESSPDSVFNPSANR